MERFGKYRIEVWISIVLLISPWVLHGVEYPNLLIQELDHCPELGCDFVRHYLPQAESARARLPKMNNGWFYPPLPAILLIPFTLFNQASLLWAIVNLCGVIILVRMIRSPRSLVPGLFAMSLYVTSLPTLHAIKWGQVSIWLALLLCLSLFPNGVAIADRSSSKREQDSEDWFINKWTAWLLGLAGAIKIYPMVFLLLPLLRNRLVWVLHSVLAFVLFGAFLPWLWLGDDVWNYLYAVQRGQQVVSDMGSIAGGQALSPALHRWFISGEFIGASSTGSWSDAALLMSIPWLKPIVMLGAVTVLGRIVWSLRTTVTVSTVFALLIVIHLLLQPGWVHYFCWLPLVHVWCWYQARGKSTVLWGIGLVILLERLPLIFLDRSTYFMFARAGWMTLVLLLTLMVLFYLSSTTEDHADEKRT